MDLSAIMSLQEFPLLYALAIGIITAIGPCPLSANVTAIAYVSSKMSDSRSTMLAGAMYTAGRATTYTIIGMLIFLFGSTVMDNAPSLQDYDKIILGPVLILAGVVMLGLWKPDFSAGEGLKDKYGLMLSEKGSIGAFFLGAVFALAFCPYTAVMFFGLLMPFALAANAPGISFMALFGIGTGIPVLLFAVLLGISSSFAKAYISRITRVEPYLRKVLGAGFILYGAWMIVAFIFRVQ